MSSLEELPEHCIFHVLRRGEEQPIGPFSQNQLVELLNESAIQASDYVYYDAMSDWKPIHQVFDLHQKLTNLSDDGQDPIVVENAFNHINSHLYEGEELFYIAVQDQPALSLTAAVKLSHPKSIVLTSHRACVIRQKVMGEIEMDEYPMATIREGLKRIKPNEGIGSFNLILNSGDWVETNKINRVQLDHLEEITNTVISEMVAA